jgi:hypothetical protein
MYKIIIKLINIKMIKIYSRFDTKFICVNRIIDNKYGGKYWEDPPNNYD